MKRYTRCVECCEKMFVGDDCLWFDEEIFCSKECLFDYVDYRSSEDEVCEGDLDADDQE